MPSKSLELNPYRLILFDRAIAFAVAIDALIFKSFPGPKLTNILSSSASCRFAKMTAFEVLAWVT